MPRAQLRSPLLGALVALLLSGCGEQTSTVAPTPVRPDNASTLAAWMPADGTVAVIIGHPSHLADLVAYASKAFAGVPAAEAAIEGARALTVGPMRPAANAWGPGLALDRGAAFFLGSQGPRVVFGADDVEKALLTLQATFAAAGEAAPVDPSAKTFMDLKCALRGGLAVCEGGDAPQTAPGIPAGLKKVNIANTVVAAFIGPGAPFLQKEDVPITEGWVTWHADDTSTRLSLRTRLGGPAAMVLSFIGKKASPGVMAQVSRGEPFLKIGLEMDTLRPLVAGMRSQLPPTLQTLASRIMEAWSGDLVWTFDGSLTHPVLVFGLADKTRGEPLVKSLAEVISSACGTPCAQVVPSTRKGQHALRFEVDLPNDEHIRVDLQFGVVGDTLVFALAPADLERRRTGKLQATDPGRFAEAGVHGVRTSNVFLAWGTPWSREFLNLGSVQDVTTVVSLASLFFSATELRLTTNANQIGIDVELQALPSAGPGRAEYDAAMRTALMGDELAAQGLWVNLAAEHPNTEFGRIAKSQLGGSLAAMLPVVGILAAVAIPAFMKYVRRSKTTEATMNVTRLSEGALSYASQQRVDAAGTVLPRHFPASVPLTPGNPRQYMCQGGDSVKFTPTTETWSHPTWRALGFSVGEPFYYAYEFVSAGVGTEAMFTARAIGDLNCDGILSTFERVGHFKEDGSILGGAGIFTNNELE